MVCVPHIATSERGLCMCDFYNQNGRSQQYASSASYRRGQCDGKARDAVFVERDGIVAGSIHVDGKGCLIRSGRFVECTNLADLPDEEEYELNEDDDDNERKLYALNYQSGFVPHQQHQQQQQQISNENKSLRGSSSQQHGERRLIYDDGGSTLDVMVVWTRETECRYNNLGNDETCALTIQTKNNIKLMVEMLVEEANMAFTESGIPTQLRLVHAYRHESYIESSSTYMALKRLKDVADGDLDDVHAKRVLYGADLVHMIIGRKGCGAAYHGPSKQNSFSVSRYTCALQQYSFIHEIAHSLGGKFDLVWETPFFRIY